MEFIAEVGGASLESVAEEEQLADRPMGSLASIMNRITQAP